MNLQKYFLDYRTYVNVYSINISGAYAPPPMKGGMPAQPGSMQNGPSGNVGAQGEPFQPRCVA